MFKTKFAITKVSSPVTILLLKISIIHIRGNSCTKNHKVLFGDGKMCINEET